MADRPIIFAQSMVRALLADNKTMTRRLLKPQPEPFVCADGSLAEVAAVQVDDEPCPRIALGRVLTRQKVRFAVGDRLWVREAWRTTDSLDHLSPSEIRKQCLEAGYLWPWAPLLYLADNTAMNWLDEKAAEGRRRASMHMPRWASRITLAVTAVRVERLQDVTETDARAEGVLYVPGHGEITTAELCADPGYSNFLNCRQGFEVMWKELHGPGAWGSNPWVVEISFDVERGGHG